MSDTKKPGPKNIQDLKAKLGLKTPSGGAAGAPPKPPTVTPPPGLAPPVGGDVPAPPGVVPPAGIQPPPGLTPAPPAATPAPGVPAPPAGNLVAPPGMAPPPTAAPAPASSADEPQFVTGSAVAQVDVDMGVVEQKGSRRLIWILVAGFASLLTMCGGYYFGDNRLRSDWVKRSKKAARTTAGVVKTLNRGIVQFRSIFEQEVDKTKQGRTPLAYYNPDLFTKLEEAAATFDTEKPKVKALLNKRIWTTHYRFVKGAGDLLPRLHKFLSLCQQIQIAVRVAQQTERQFANLLKLKTADAKRAKAKDKPEFGVMIYDDHTVGFSNLLKPCKGKKPVDKPSEANGYQFSDNKCHPFPTPPKTPRECPQVNGTIRVFRTDDAELYNRLKCRGQEDVVFKAWRYQVVQIQMLIKEIDKVDPKGLATAFLKAAR